MFLVAYAILEIENTDSWYWFIQLLGEDLNIGLGTGWTFISDRQKGLRTAIDALIPYVEHRFCVRHMYNNFKGTYKGKSLKDKMWNAARVTYVEQFNSAMAKVQEEDELAYAWLYREVPEHWTRSHFSTSSKCDILLNMCEAFNKTILFAKDKPILVMLEMIRDYLMRRLQLKRDKIANYKCQFTPNVEKLLEKLKLKPADVIVKYAGDMKFEVTHVSGSRDAVDLKNEICGCRRWQLNGIPCPHAITCMQYMQWEPEPFVNKYYSKEAYVKAYQYIIEPMNGQSMWEKTDIQPLRPPSFHKQPERPKKLRKKEVEEVAKVP